MSPAAWKSTGPRHWLVVAWQSGVRRVLEAMIGPDALSRSSLEARIPEPGAWSRWLSPVWRRLVLDAIPKGAVSVGCPHEALLALGRWIAADPGLGETDCLEVFVELVNQAAASTADLISERLEGRVKFSATESDGPLSLDYAIEVKIPLPDSSYPMAFVPSPEFLDWFETSANLTEVAVLPPLPATSPPPKNFDLLQEVELPVCVTFGRTQLPLKDVLKLSSGSIVELNRLANEPVEVLINNSVIARGEVVVVDGNYGIRVTEIVSRQERIRSIF